MEKKQVLIIGSGIGGLATAILLARQGLKVSVFEKNHAPGGRCQHLEKDGHVFDTGPTMYLFPEIYADFFSQIGENVADHLNLIRTDPTYRLNFPDHTHLTLTSDLERMRSQLEALEPGSFHCFLKYLDTGREHYRLAIGQIAHSSLARPLDYLSPQLLYRILKTRALFPHYAYTQKFFRHPHLSAAFTFQNSYLSLHPFHAPAVYSLFTFSELTHGSFLPQGGLHQLSLALEKIARRHGVRFKYRSPVKRINVTGNHAQSLTLADGAVIPADFVISNADLSFTYQHLLPSDPFTPQLLKKRYSCSAVAFHWGLDKIFPQLQTHNLFFSHPYGPGFDSVINRPEPPDQPHFYIQAPTRTDPSRAPHNQDTLTVMVPINHLDPAHPVNWEKYRRRLRHYIFNRLHQSGLHRFRDHIKFELSYLPGDWQQHLNLTHGSIYGLDHNLTQIGPLRPSRQHRRYQNLFFVGSSTHPGSGLPTVLLSARFTAQRLLTSLT